MKTADFKVLSTPERLETLIRSVQSTHYGRFQAKTSHGVVFTYIDTYASSDVSAYELSSKLGNPEHVCIAVPGLSAFSCKENTGLIAEVHNMYASNNAYSGRFFKPSQLTWAMTNHPVLNDNIFDIPHNVVYNFYDAQNTGAVTIGIEFASSGRISQYPLLSIAAEAVARASISFTMKKIGSYIRNQRKLEPQLTFSKA